MSKNREPLSENQAEIVRLQTLLEYQILDTTPEIEYDDVTNLASLICDAPVALINLMDSDRAWFKSRVGLDADSVPREIAFCDKTIQGNEVYVIPDAKADVLYKENPLVFGAANFGFYAGAPILAPNGCAVGTVCVLDNRPRTLTQRQIDALEALARQVANQLEIRKTNATLRTQYQMLQDSAKKITQQEQALVYAAKMSALGEMASGIAHEINNPLAIIMGYNEIVREWAEKNKLDGDRVKELCQRIELTGGRVAKTISSLRAFTKEGKNEKFERVLVKDVLAQTLDFCRSRFKNHRISLHVGAFPEGLEMECQRTQLGHVILNLLSNAFEAVEDRSEKWVRFEVADYDDNISFSVTDSGPGVADEIRAHIMRPFFSAKKGGKGAGLGLSVAQGVLETHGGTLSLDTASSHTRFVAVFPKRQVLAELKVAA